MSKLIVLNHKMGLMYDEVYSYIEKTNNYKTDHNLIICPSSLYLEAFVNHSLWAIGSQNLNHHLDLNHTGEISSLQLKSLGIEYAIIGHSECLETDDIVNLKVQATLDSNIIPILCFGEDKGQDFEEEITKQLDKRLKDINHIEFIIFAYEPVYAIGNGNPLDTEEIELKIKFIKNYLEEKYKVLPNVIYGGSVNEDNIEDILNLDIVDGVLIGSKSADSEKLSKIID